MLTVKTKKKKKEYYWVIMKITDTRYFEKPARAPKKSVLSSGK